MWPRRRRERSRVRARLHARRRRPPRRDHASKRGGVRARLPAGRNPRARSNAGSSRARPRLPSRDARTASPPPPCARDFRARTPKTRPGRPPRLRFSRFRRARRRFRILTRDRVPLGIVVVSSRASGVLDGLVHGARGILRGAFGAVRPPPRERRRAPPRIRRLERRAIRLDVPREIRNRHRGGRLGGRDGGVHPAGEGRVGMPGVDARARE